ncbi:unnamed protein product, partial [marine sediment metagenome]
VKLNIHKFPYTNGLKTPILNTKSCLAKNFSV